MLKKIFLNDTLSRGLVIAATFLSVGTNASLVTNNESADISLSGYQQPNIVLFLVDDMGWQDTSVPFSGKPTPSNQFFETPNISELAKKGVMFTQAYSHSVCTPSRVSLMTGRNPTRHHVTNWTKLPDVEHSGTWGPNGPPARWRKEGLQPQDVTLPKLLKMSGYQTIHVGKAHFGAYGTEGGDPTNLGFTVNVAGHAAGAPASYWGEKDFGNNMQGAEGLPQGVPGLEEYHQKAVHLTDVLTERAIGELTKAKDNGAPFFLNMAYYAVHTPIEAHKRFVKRYQNKPYLNTNIDIPEIEENYASLVAGVDDSIAKIMKHLDKLNLAENTLIIFTSDNGGLSGHSRETTPRGTELNSHNWPLNSGKGSAYEGGTRVPYIVTWAKPSKVNKLQKHISIPSHRTSKQHVMIEDLFPTILNIAKSKQNIPADYEYDGIDVLRNWQEPEFTTSRPVVFHYPHVWGPHGPGYEPHSAMRLGDWKVIYFYNSKTWKLFDLIADIGEQNNLASLDPKRLTRLATRLKYELESMDVQWPANRMTGKNAVMTLP